MSELAGRAAFVTGAGSGIGRAIARALAEQGAHVWATDADGAVAAETVAQIEQGGGGAAQIRLDVSDEAQWQSALARSRCSADRPGQLRRNLRRHRHVLDAARALPAHHVRERRRHVPGHEARHSADRGARRWRVLNISSIAGLKGMASWTAYCGSKGAIRRMTKAMALECAELRNKVRVNSVHPGFADTPALRWSIEHGHRSAHAHGSAVPDLAEVAHSAVPIGVACSPEEIGATACFLASNAARHITGAEIVIDGGVTAG